MFSRILIANRGEIACRIARSCARLGIESIAVHSRADAGALHVKAADRAVALRGEHPADGYLDVPQIVAAAARCGAEAIHPGYGFLAENAGFAAACQDAGMRFIGPGPGIIRDMADKARARRLAAECGVPVVPGVEEERGSDGEHADAALCAAVTGLRYPLMVKACAGGGGRGMRRVDRPADLTGAIAAARGEARASFGDDRLIVEHCIARPRHLEVQILADGHGTVLHLHERDCSIQRRHQKLIEEAPAPGLDDDTRRALHASALTLARAIGYQNAGTVEFILDPGSGAFFFLEMNTRLQVEHPVTEAILGLDLVEWQLRIAAGEALDFGQHDLTPRGWAMEARINAEDPSRGFQPATGTVLGYREPQRAQVRVDSGVGDGSRVEPWYDSMLAKLIVHGHDRRDAAERLAAALGEMRLMGVRNNTAFLADLARSRAFCDGDVSTAFIDERHPHGWRPALSREDSALAAAAWLCTSEDVGAGPWTANTGFRVLAPAGHPGCWRLLLDDGEDDPLAVWVRPDGAAWRMAVTQLHAPRPDLDAAARIGARRGAAVLDLELGGRTTRLTVLEREGWVHLHADVDAPAWQRLAPEHALHAMRAAGAAVDGPLRAPVPGVVASLEVQVGDRVAAGAPLLVMESMKMYQTLTAPMAATVSAVHCAAGDGVRAGQDLMTLEPGTR